VGVNGWVIKRVLLIAVWHPWQALCLVAALAQCSSAHFAVHCSSVDPHAVISRLMRGRKLQACACMAVGLELTSANPLLLEPRL
jgi:hypothetical protein